MLNKQFGNVIKKGVKKLPLFQKIKDANAPKAVVIKTSKENCNLRKK